MTYQRKRIVKTKRGPKMIYEQLGDDSAGTDEHGCTPDQVWNDSAGSCVSLDQNLALINQGVAAAAADNGGDSNSGAAGTAASAAGAFLKGLFGGGSAPKQQVVAQQGMSGTTKVLLVAGGVGALVYLATRK